MMIPTVRARHTNSPFATLNGVRPLDELFNSLTNGATETWTMPAEIVETAAELRLALEVPGLRPEDIELTIENGVLTVSAEKKIERREGETDENYRLFERRYGRHARSFRLPRTVDASQVQASCEHGVLTIRLPRAEEAKPRRIPVTDAKAAPEITRGENG